MFDVDKNSEHVRGEEAVICRYVLENGCLLQFFNIKRNKLTEWLYLSRKLAMKVGKRERKCAHLPTVNIPLQRRGKQQTSRNVTMKNANTSQSSKHQKLLFLRQRSRLKLKLFWNFNTGDTEFGKTEARQLREFKINTFNTPFNGNWKQFSWC